MAPARNRSAGDPAWCSDGSCRSLARVSIILVSKQKLWSDVLRLPPEERAELAYVLLESLHGENEPEADGRWLAELDRRAQAVADGTATLVDWDLARERIAARLKARRRGLGPDRG